MLPDFSPLSLSSPANSAQNSAQAVPEKLEAESDRAQQVIFKSESDRLLLILPGEVEAGDIATGATWGNLWQQLKQRLTAGERFWQPETAVHLIAKDRLLDTRQLQDISDALAEVQLRLKQVTTSRRQTAVAAVTAGYSVDQHSTVASLSQAPPPEEPKPTLVEPLYLQTTLRSGAEVRHAGSVVIVGDVNPGSAVIAEGDILIWGRLRGVAHAGVKGNAQCRIMALQMEPTQIRIADYVARSPAKPPAQYYPEVAYVSPEGIRITKATDFAKAQLTAAIAIGQPTAKSTSAKGKLG